MPLIAAVAERADAVDDTCLRGDFPIEQQRAFCLSILRRFGYTEKEWRFDPTAHPFATNTSLGDIRLTTRYYADNVAPSLFGSIHECGHGLYQHGVSPTLERTRRCAAAHRTACTSRRAACGRTSSAAAARRGVASFRN